MLGDYKAVEPERAARIIADAAYRSLILEVCTTPVSYTHLLRGLLGLGGLLRLRGGLLRVGLRVLEGDPAAALQLAPEQVVLELRHDGDDIAVVEQALSLIHISTIPRAARRAAAVSPRSRPRAARP